MVMAIGSDMVILDSTPAQCIYFICFTSSITSNFIYLFSWNKILQSYIPFTSMTLTVKNITILAGMIQIVISMQSKIWDTKAPIPVDLLSFWVDSELVLWALAAKLIKFALDMFCSPDVVKPVMGKMSNWFGREGWNKALQDTQTPLQLVVT
jgi:hypothetical protein